MLAIKHYLMKVLRNLANFIFYRLMLSPVLLLYDIHHFLFSLCHKFHFMHHFSILIVS
jgi:hypothetical protein